MQKDMLEENQYSQTEESDDAFETEQDIEQQKLYSGGSYY